jgi:DNA-binding CsgD family transcriptional regulator
LGLGDLRKVEVFLTDLYELADVSGFQQRLLLALSTLIPADRISVIESNPRLRAAAGKSMPSGAFDGDLQRAYGQHIPQSPFIKAYERGKGSAVKLSDFLTQRQLHRLGLYSEYLRKIDSEYRLAKGLPGRPGWVTSVQLDRRSRDFSERDRLVLNILRPHLNLSYRNAVTVTAAHLELSQIREGVEALDCGLVLLTAEGAVQWMSARARQWLGDYFRPHHIRDRSLPDPLARWLKWHTDTRERELPQPREPFVMAREGARLLVRLSVRHGQTVLVVEEQRLSVPAQALRSLGLTRRESQVLAWVAEGKASADVARILSISRRGVEKHLEHIYAKLGVETRTAAAARALGAVSSLATFIPG